MVLTGWVALFAANGIPSDGLAELERQLMKALSDASVVESLKKRGVGPVAWGRAKTEEFLRAEDRRWGQLIRERNIRSD
mgnify:CR=1 FL=1